MRILILSTHRDGAGGVERFSSYLANVFLGNGDTVTILGKEDVSRFGKILLSFSGYVALGQPILGFLLGDKARKMGFDICVTNGMLGWNLSKGKILNVQHGTFAKAAERIDKNKNKIKFFIKRYIWGYFEGLAARQATQCIAVSNETKESIEQYYKVHDCMVIANAVDTDLFRPTNVVKKNQVIFVGRFEEAKGKTILVDFQLYLNRKGWELIVAENYTQNELVILYNESRLFLLPSLHEGCSYALLEAMACGVPFLASPVGLVRDFEINQLFSGCVVSRQTSEGYIEAFEKILKKSEAETLALSNQLREYIVAYHSLEAFGEAYKACIQTL